MVAMLGKALRYLELHTVLFSAISINYRLQRKGMAGAGRPYSLLVVASSKYLVLLIAGCKYY